MTQFTSLSEILNLATGSAEQRLYVGNKGMTTNGGALYAQSTAVWMDTWDMDGRTPNGTTPGTVAAPTSSTQGAVEFKNATASHTKYLIGFDVYDESASHGQVLLYDRLLHISGFSGTVTTAQTVGGTITRNTGGEGNEIWLVVYSDVGATASTITASYTNQAGTASRTTIPIRWPGDQIASSAQQATFGLPLQDGDTGVQSVQSVTLASTTGTAGNFGCVIARPLAVASPSYFIRGTGGRLSFLESALKPVALEDNSCLAVAYTSIDSGEVDMSFSIYTIEKAD